MKIDRGGAGWIIFILAAVIALVFLVSALIGQARAQHSGHRPQDMELHYLFSGGVSTALTTSQPLLMRCHIVDGLTPANFDASTRFISWPL